MLSVSSKQNELPPREWLPFKLADLWRLLTVHGRLKLIRASLRTQWRRKFCHTVIRSTQALQRKHCNYTSKTNGTAQSVEKEDSPSSQSLHHCIPCSTSKKVWIQEFQFRLSSHTHIDFSYSKLLLIILFPHITSNHLFSFPWTETYLELWQSLDSFERSENTKDTQGFDGINVLPFAASVEICGWGQKSRKNQWGLKSLQRTL